MSRSWKASAVIPKETMAIYFGSDIYRIGRVCKVVADTAATSKLVMVKFSGDKNGVLIPQEDLDYVVPGSDMNFNVRKQHANEANEVYRRCGTEYPSSLH